MSYHYVWTDRLRDQKEKRLHTPVNSNQRRKYGSDKSYGDVEKDFSIPRISIKHCIPTKTLIRNLIKGKNLNSNSITFRHTPWKEENSVAGLAKRTFLPSFGVLRTEAEEIKLRLDPTFWIPVSFVSSWPCMLPCTKFVKRLVGATSQRGEREGCSHQAIE